MKEDAAPKIPKIVIVIPTFNEAENLPVVYERICEQNIPGLCFIIVDDNSPDGTGQIADDLSARHDGVFRVIHRCEKKGLGRAYVAGFKAAIEEGAEIVVEMDADLSHPPEEIPRMLQALEGHDVVVGTRYMDGGGVDPSWSLGRRWLSWLGNAGIRVLVGIAVADATSGFKVFRRSALERVDLDSLRSDGFAFQAEMTLACERAGLRIAQHPYSFRMRAAGDSKMSAGIVYEAVVRLLPLRFKRW
jgi:dolichol-phosphate mannosyltransferase